MTWILNQGWLIAAFVPILILIQSIRILREYQRGVIFLLGRFWKVKGPGLIIVPCLSGCYPQGLDVVGQHSSHSGPLSPI
jgi:hypothetical protein